MNVADRKDMVKLPRRTAIVLTVVLVCIVGTGIPFYRSQREQLRRQVEADLDAIAVLKAKAIAEWRVGQLSEAFELESSPLFIAAVARWFSAPNAAAEEEIRERLHSLQEHYRYRDVMLVDTDGNVRLSLAGRTTQLAPETSKALALSLADRKSLLTDLRMDSEAQPCLDVIVPLIDDRGEAPRLVGAAIMQNDASRYLLPLIASWPITQSSAETLLVRRDGDDVLFLNELRHQKGTTLKLRIPLTRTDLPVVMGVLGRKDLMEGKDYRGVEVLAVLKAIPDSPWFMMVKVDALEAFAVWRMRSSFIMLSFASVILLLAAIAGVAWQRSEKRHYRQLFRAETARFKIQERSRAILMSIGDGVIVTDADQRIELLNAVAESLTGWQLTEAMGRPIEEVFRIVNEETRKPVQNPVRRVLSDGVVVGLANHTVLLARDGIERPIADAGAPIRDATGAVTGVVLVFRDQTRERAAQKALQAAADEWTATFNAASDSICLIAADCKIIRCNKATESLLGKPLEAITGRPCWEVFHGTPMPIQECPLQVALKSKHREAVDLPVGERWWRIAVDPILDSGGKVNGAIQNLRDITERKQAELEIQRLLQQSEKDRRALLGILEDQQRDQSALRESERRYRAVFDGAQDGMALADAETGKLVDCNSSLCRMVECDKTALVGQQQSILYPRRDLANGLTPGFSRLVGKAPGQILEEALLSKSGRTIAVEISAARIRMGDRDYLLGIFRDITERKRREDEIEKLNRNLRQALVNLKETQDKVAQHQRLSALGQLASGIAHDFNNALMPVMGYSEMILESPELMNDPEELISMVKHIQTAGKDAQGIVRRMRDIYKGGEDNMFREVDVVQLIESALSLTAPKWKTERSAEGKHIRVVTNLEEGVAVMGVEHELREALTNLILNSIDAMPDGGILTFDSHVEGASVFIKVRDTGIGMTPEVLRKCMEPYFTTKGTRGSGLGLALVHGIVTRHGGEMTVYSEPGCGTEVKIRLSEAGGKQKMAEVEDSTEAVSSLASLNILLIDDDIAVGSVLLKYLTMDNHQVQFLTTGRQAIAKLEAERFDLVITDRAMGNLSGDEVAKAAKKISPETRVIMITGFGDLMLDRKELPAGVDWVVSKPVSRNELRQAIRMAMKRSA